MPTGLPPACARPACRIEADSAISTRKTHSGRSNGGDAG
jgi:hypothetical protein